MTSITEVKDRFAQTTIDFDSEFEWLIATNVETSFASLASKLKSYHNVVTNKVAKQLDKVILSRTLDLFYTLFYNVYNCTQESDKERFNIHMDIISHFYANFVIDNVSKKAILRYDISKFLTKKKYGTWLALLELMDKLSDKTMRPRIIGSVDFDSILDRDKIYMHDFGIEALKSYYKG